MMNAKKLLEALRDSGTGIEKIRAVAAQCGPKTTGLQVVEMFQKLGHQGTVQKALGILEGAGVALVPEVVPSVIPPGGIEISAPADGGPALDDVIAGIEKKLGPGNVRATGPGVFDVSGADAMTAPGVGK